MVVLTSFPKELFESYKQAFEQKYPGVKVVVKQQQTNLAVTYLRETRAKPEADIVWVSAVDVFQTLKGDGLLDRIALPKELLARIPARVGGFSLHDPDGQYWGFAVSGYGLMWNTRYLALHKLAEARWLVSTVPLDGKQAIDKSFNEGFRDKPDVKSLLETEWDTKVKASYGKAQDCADQAARMR